MTVGPPQRDGGAREASLNKRRRVRTHRQIVEGRMQVKRWGAWTTAIFGVLAALRVLLAVIRAGTFSGRHALGLSIAGSLLLAAWIQQRQIRAP